MKYTLDNSLSLTVVIAVCTLASSALPSIAQSGNYKFYWGTPNSNHTQPLYVSANTCRAAHSDCVNFGDYCGRKYISSRRVYDNAKRFWGQGYTLKLKSRSNGKIVCNVSP